MELKINIIETLPKLSWLTRIEKDNNTATLYCGKWVDCNKGFFVEGAWEDDFEKGNFDESLAFTGSGGIVDNEKIKFVTPYNTIEAIYSTKLDDNYYFSNSISFLLETTNQNLDFNYLDYENDILSITDGIFDYIREIPLNNGNTIELHYFENININTKLQIVKEDKHKPRNFNSFKEYKGFLIDTLKHMNENFNSRKRKQVFNPIVFTSNGYDSSTCAALGKEIGCNKAVVFESKKSKIDTGKPIAELLGYNEIIEKDELDYLKTNCTEDFVANGEIGTSIYFSVVENELEGTFVLSGGHGDLIWDRHGYPNNKILRDFFAGSSRKEYRLRVGFQILMIPFFSAQSHEDIYKITNADEMKPWTLGNDYDRPIARRIVEEKGIPREKFGMEKDGGVASSLRFLNLTYLKKVMPKADFKEFKQYYKKNKKYRNKGFNYVKHSLKYTMYILKLIMKQKKIIKDFKEPDRKYKCSPWAPSFLFFWGVDKVRRRYEIRGINDDI